MNKPKVNKNTLSNFYSDAKPMFLASIFTQSFAFIANLYLAKLYGENAFGILGSFFSFSVILSIIFTLQLEHNIITKHSKKIFWYNTTQIVSIINTTIICLIIGLLYLLFEFNTNYNFIIYSVLGGFLFALIITNENLLTANSLFSKIALGKVIISISTAIIQLLFFSKFEKHGLI